MKARFLFIVVSAFILGACHSATSGTENTALTKNAEKHEQTSLEDTQVADAATILAKKEVPVLCYHHIKDLKPGDGPLTKTYSVTPAHFAEQMKALKDNGYHTILPGQLYNYLVHGASLPAKPVILSLKECFL